VSSRETTPLDGVRVLEFAHLFPGPYAGLVLGSLGAEVVKVESPIGDATREIPPYVEDSGGGAGAVFCALNRSKLSVQLDLKDEDDAATYRDLAATADVVIDGYSPGVAEDLGVGYETLAADRDQLVYAHLSGYGPEGVMAGEPGHDVTYQAWAGTLDEDPPRLPNVPAADVTGALWVTTLVLAHLGEGCTKLEPSLTGSLQASGLIQDTIHVASGDEDPLSGGLPGYGVYECSNGQWLALGALEPDHWRALCLSIGDRRLHELGDPRDPEDPEQARQILADRIATQPREAWLSRLRETGVPCAPVRGTAEALDKPLELPSVDPPGVDTEADLMGAPALGEHTDDVLAEIEP
jgi:crotonobetainyl-CoA:carnitine CoA-transferase CaiB-like acyl-CoA transferase